MLKGPSPLDAGSALFLDFDGTLVDLAERPDAVRVPRALGPLLAGLWERLGGALALVSGRPLAELDALLAPLMLPAAGVHGTERRRADGSLLRLPTPQFGVWEQRLAELASAHPGVLLERKPGALALHYRQAPACESACVQAMQAAAADLPGLRLLHGKMVAELKPAQASKAHAIEAFLAEPPFAGRRAVFAGDDVTDESGFAAVQARGGEGIKVGAGPSEARHRLPNPAALHAWLGAAEALQ